MGRRRKLRRTAALRHRQADAPEGGLALLLGPGVAHVPRQRELLAAEGVAGPFPWEQVGAISASGYVAGGALWNDYAIASPSTLVTSPVTVAAGDVREPAWGPFVQ